MFFVRDMFYLAAFFYLLACLSVNLLPWGISVFSRCLFCIGLLANLFSVIGRYYFSWPLMPMYQAPFFLPLFIGILSLKTIWHRQAGLRLLVVVNLHFIFDSRFFPK